MLNPPRAVMTELVMFLSLGCFSIPKEQRTELGFHGGRFCEATSDGSVAITSAGSAHASLPLIRPWYREHIRVFSMRSLYWVSELDFDGWWWRRAWTHIEKVTVIFYCSYFIIKDTVLSIKNKASSNTIIVYDRCVRVTKTNSHSVKVKNTNLASCAM